MKYVVAAMRQNEDTIVEIKKHGRHYHLSLEEDGAEMFSMRIDKETLDLLAAAIDDWRSGAS